MRRPNFAAAIVALAAFAYVAVRSIEFLAQSGYPPGYFFDLGVHILATSYQSSTIRTLPDLLDCIGWAAWADIPQFSYNPMTTSTILVAICKLGASTQLAIKLLTVLQLWIAFLSTFVLYRTFRRSRVWASIAGLIYMLLPATALQVSSNFDIGFCVALTPLALALGIRLIRRFGSAGLPLAGAICGFAGQGFAIEYLFVLSLPLYVIIVLSAYRKHGRVPWVIGSLAGFICAVGVGLFTMLPTFASSAVLSSPASRIAESESGGVLALFGESLTALWHAVLTENTLSPWPEFNDSSLLWSTSLALTVLWGLALAFAARRIDRGGLFRLQALCVASLILLAFGSAVPFAATFWAFLGHVPLLQFLRTPDRLVIIPFTYLVWWGTAELEAYCRLANAGRNRRWRSLGCAACAALIIVSLSFFDFEAGSLIVRPSLAYRLPDLTRINASARTQPPPLVAYTFVNQGSVLNTPLYGDGERTRIIAQDLISRYGLGPGHALGMLRKAGIPTVVTTPVWAVDAQSWPDLGAAYANNRWVHRVFGSPSSPAVWRVDEPAPDLSSTQLACFHGGPGTLDAISQIPIVHQLALRTGPGNCSVDIYANADPRDDVSANSVAAWAGATFSDAQIRDHDYAFIMTRMLLSRPWYRNAIDGDTPDFGRPAVLIRNRWRATVISRTRGRPEYVAGIRRTAPFDGCFSISVDGTRAGKRCSHGDAGFHWMEIPVRLNAGTHSMTYSVVPSSKFSFGPQFLDGITLAREGQAFAKSLPRRPRIVAYTTTWLIDGSRLRWFWIPSGRYHAGWIDPSGKLLRKPVKIDGSIAPKGEVTISRSSLHRSGSPPPGSAMLLFASVDFPTTLAEMRIGQKRSATTWDVALASHKSTLRATVLNDRSWALDGFGRHFDGIDCDLVDTCFENVPPGRYVLHHRWPQPIVLGLLASLATWLLAVAPCLPGLRRTQRSKIRFSSRSRLAESGR